jgi:hypothetical protein
MRFVILDVQAAHGIEPSACTLLRRLRRQLAIRGITLLVAAASAHMEVGLCRHDRPSRAPPGSKHSHPPAGASDVAGAAALGARPMRSCFFRSADEALEFCEDALLALGSPEKAARPRLAGVEEGPLAGRAAGGVQPDSAPAARHLCGDAVPREGAPSVTAGGSKEDRLPGSDPRCESNMTACMGARPEAGEGTSGSTSGAGSRVSGGAGGGAGGGGGGAGGGVGNCKGSGKGGGVGSVDNGLWSSTSSFQSCDACGADTSTHSRSNDPGGATPLPSLSVRPYTLDSRGAPALPFAPSTLPPGLPWDAVVLLGSESALRPGELLTAQGKLSREVIVVPPSGAELIVSTDFGSSDGPLRLAALRHGGVFGVEGVLLSLPSVATTVLAPSSGPRVVVTLSAAQLRAARRSQPQLVQQLLAASYAQQQDFLWMLARRTSLWTGGGHAGPRFDASAAPAGLVSAGIPSIPSVASMPESFGRMQIESVVAAPWRVAETAGVSAAPRLFGGRYSVGHVFGLAGAWQPPADQQMGSSLDRNINDPSRMRRFGGSSTPSLGRPGQPRGPASGARVADAATADAELI